MPVHADRIKAFAAEFDPQPFHLDERAARGTIFGGLVASGWHTAAMTMRLLVESDLNPVGGIVGAGFEEFRWTRPVRPGDELLETEVIEVRPSRSRLSPHLSDHVLRELWQGATLASPYTAYQNPTQKAAVRALLTMPGGFAAREYADGIGQESPFPTRRTVVAGARA